MIGLDAIASSAAFNPQKIIIYGVQGLGKTTFGCTFEAPVLLRTEDGAAALDVPTFPLARSYADVIEMLQALHGDHPFRTLVLDSLDWLEPLVHAETCRELDAKSIEEPGFGKGYVEADKHWSHIIGGFDSLRLNKGMNVVLIAHSEIRTFNSPDSAPFDRYQIKLQKRIAGRLQEWADMVLFCSYDKHTVQTKTNGREQVRAEGTGLRVVCTDERPAWLAKNRWSLPAQIRIGSDKGWKAFHEALSAATGGRYAVPGAQTISKEA